MYIPSDNANRVVTPETRKSITERSDFGIIKLWHVPTGAMFRYDSKWYLKLSLNVSKNFVENKPVIMNSEVFVALPTHVFVHGHLFLLKRVREFVKLKYHNAD